MGRPVVGVVGLGYVGDAVYAGFSEVAALRFCDPARPGSVPLAALADADVVFVCVPTPAGPDGAADLSIVADVLDGLAGTRATVVLKSTVPPGTTDRFAASYPHLALAVAPEFLRERHARADFDAPARVVLGWTAGLAEARREAVRGLYRRRFPDVPVVELDAAGAELVKYASNAFFAVKVSFANELAELAGALGVPWDAARAALALDPRIGADHLAVPGPDGHRGYGGSCLPKDVAALLRHAEGLGVALPVVTAARAANVPRREPK